MLCAGTNKRHCLLVARSPIDVCCRFILASFVQLLPLCENMTNTAHWKCSSPRSRLARYHWLLSTAQATAHFVLCLCSSPTVHKRTNKKQKTNNNSETLRNCSGFGGVFIVNCTNASRHRDVIICSSLGQASGVWSGVSGVGVGGVG